MATATPTNAAADPQLLLFPEPVAETPLERRRRRQREAMKRHRLRHPDRVKARDKAYDDRHREERKAHKRDYAQKNSERERARTQSWEANNKERAQANRRLHYLRNAEKIKARSKAWAANNPEKRRAESLHRVRMRQSRLLSATIGDPKEIKAFYAIVRNADVVVCAYCLNEVPKGKRQVDHVIPLTRGGPHCVGNLAPACGPCNRAKMARTPEEFSAWLAEKEAVAKSGASRAA